MIELIRVQDEEGRGPYRPGFSHHWTDPGHESRNPSIFDEFDMDAVRGEWDGKAAMGCAFRTLEQLRAWFSESELARLLIVGYDVVRIDADRIMAESARQVIFTRRRPLRFGAVALHTSLQQGGV